MPVQSYSVATGIGAGAFLVGKSAAAAGTTNRAATPERRIALMKHPHEPDAGAKMEQIYTRFDGGLCLSGNSLDQKFVTEMS